MVRRAKNVWKTAGVVQVNLIVIIATKATNLKSRVSNVNFY